MPYNTVHIFGYGETQVIEGKKSSKVAITDVQSSVDAVVSNVYSKKPVDSDASADYHAINIFKDLFVDYQPKTGKGFRVKITDLNGTAIEALATAIDSLYNSTTTTTTAKP